MPIKKIAVIGLGSIGTRHFCNVLELGYEAIGFDPSIDAREKLEKKVAEEFADASFSFTNTLQSALEQCDAVIIANPHKYHFETLSQCVDAGKHCLVEKPLAVETEGLEALLRRAQDQRLTVSVGFNMRFRPVVRAARKALEGLGNIYWARFICASYLPDWRAEQDYRENYTADPETGGVVFDVSHELDLAYHLFGSGKVVAAHGENTGLLDIASEDMANITIKHDDGALSNIHLDYVTRPKRRGFECAGENGILKVDLQTHHIELFDTDNALIKDEHHKPDFNNFEYLEELKDFVRSAEKETPSLCSAEDGLRNLELILSARNFFDAGFRKAS